MVIGQPQLGVGLATVLCEVGRLPKPGGERGAVDGLAKDSRARWPRRRTAVLATVVAAASVRVVASGGPIVVVASSPADHIMVILRLASVIEAVMH